MPLPRSKATELLAKRHPEWLEHWRTWRWLADCLEGGDRYRFADYTVPPDADATAGVRSNLFLGSVPWAAQYARAAGPSSAGGVDPTTGLTQPFTYGQIVDRNLIPHSAEMGRDGFELYLLRLARTPPPTDLARVIECHLSKVFAREVRREGPAELLAWFEDVDGCGTSMGHWIEDEVGPLLLALGQLDLCVEHPAPPPGMAGKIRTKRDLLDLNLNAAVASVILPENVLWWVLDHRRRYREVLTLDRSDDGSDVWFLHWHAKGVDCYRSDGEFVTDRSREYGYGSPPIRRVFDRRKPRCKNVGKSRYEGVASASTAAYNVESERVLANVLQAHPQIQGPADLLAGGEIATGPGNALPMAAIKGRDGVTSGYQPWQFLDPPQGAHEALRQTILDYGERIDRDAALSKPAGFAGGPTVSQSGVSKAYDSQDGNAVLCRVAEVLENAEEAAAELALTVLGDRPATPEQLASVEIEYPKSFDLWTAQDVADVLQAVQTAAAQAGALPVTEAALMERLVCVALTGAPEEVMKECEDEIERFFDAIAAAAVATADSSKSQRDSTTATDSTDQIDPETEVTSDAAEH